MHLKVSEDSEPAKKTCIQQFALYFFSLSPAPTYLPHFQNPQPYSAAAVVNKAPTNGEAGGESPHEYEQLVSLRPSRPAPKPPGGTPGTYATIAAYSGKVLLCGRSKSSSKSRKVKLHL
jgi:hypothetical protein